MMKVKHCKEGIASRGTSESETDLIEICVSLTILMALVTFFPSPFLEEVDAIKHSKCR